MIAFRGLIAASLFLLTTGAAQRSWTDAVAVNLDGSRIEIRSVTSDWASDPDYVNNRQGPIYFVDCLSWIDRADVAVKHLQFIYAVVNKDGEVKRKPLPLDIHYRAEPGQVRDDHANCRSYGYANGADGLWLVAWVNVVDFADGTSWHAPPLDQMAPYIRDGLPKSDDSGLVHRPTYAH